MLALAPPTPANLRACAAAGAARGAALDVQACQGALCADLAPGDTLFLPGACGAARRCWHCLKWVQGLSLNLPCRLSASQAHAQQIHSAQHAGCLASSQSEHSARPPARGLLPRATQRAGAAVAGGWIAAETTADAAAALAGAYLAAGCAAEHLAAARVEDALGRPARQRYPGFRQARARPRPNGAPSLWWRRP